MKEIRNPIVNAVRLFLLVTLASAFTASPTFASLVGVTGDNTSGKTNTLSTGSAMPTGFHFDLGSFGNFVPTTANESLWSTNFTLAPTGSTTYSSGAFTITSPSASHTSPFLPTQLGYIWGFENSQTLSATPDQWILTSESDWLWPASTHVIWNASTATNVILGSNNSGNLETAAVSDPVPEPGTWASVAVSVAMVFVLFRSRRRTA